MKYILIALAFNLQITYPDLEVCQEARDILRAEAPLGQAGNILCIPAGVEEEKVDKVDRMLKDQPPQMFDTAGVLSDYATSNLADRKERNLQSSDQPETSSRVDRRITDSISKKA